MLCCPLSKDLSLFYQKNPRLLPIYPAKCDRTFEVGRRSRVGALEVTTYMSGKTRTYFRRVPILCGGGGRRYNFFMNCANFLEYNPKIYIIFWNTIHKIHAFCDYVYQNQTEISPLARSALTISPFYHFIYVDRTWL